MALAAHQCVAKPCGTDVLTSVLHGALIPALAVKVRGLLEGIYTRLLQVAAWTRLGVREVPTTVGEAYHQIGAPAVATVLDSELLRPQANGQHTAFQADVWRRCERSGPVVRAIASAEQRPAAESSRMTLVALWNAAAPLLLDAVCHEEFTDLRHTAAATNTPLAELERQHFGLTSAEACAHLLRL